MSKQDDQFIPFQKYKQTKTHSIDADMITGWKPKQLQNNFPINLNFNNKLFDLIISKQNIEQILYLGDRPSDSFQMHYKNKQNYQYMNYNMENIYKQFQQNQIQQQKLFVGMNPNINHEIYFDSNFESGNLDLAFKNQQNEYDLYMRVDSNTVGHNQWFYFKIQNLQQHSIKINICNFTKRLSLYNKGMKPYVFSKLTYEKQNITWIQDGHNITYKENTKNDTKKKYYTLSFTYDVQSKQLKFFYDYDDVYFAYCIPYTYSKLINFIKDLQNIQKQQHKQFEYQKIQTLSGLDIPILTFTNFQNLEIPINNRFCFIISARIHPGESNSSWIMHGIIKQLFNDQKNEILKNIVIILIPMINPDGVICGNYRSNLMGFDLNRQFKKVIDKVFFPDIYEFLNYIKEIKNQYKNNLLAYIDLHGHSIKQNAFTYGPYYPPQHNNFHICRILPFLMSKQCQIFKYKQCTFSSNKNKIHTGRIQIQNRVKILNAYTLETSFGTFKQSNQIINFELNDYLNIGNNIFKTIQEFSQINIKYAKYRRQILEKMQDKKNRKQKQQDFQEFQEKTDINLFIKESYQNLIKEIDDTSLTNDSISNTDSEPESDDYHEEERLIIQNNMIKTIDFFKQSDIDNTKKSQQIKQLIKQEQQQQKTLSVENKQLPKIQKETACITQQNLIKTDRSTLLKIPQRQTQRQTQRSLIKQKQFSESIKQNKNILNKVEVTFGESHQKQVKLFNQQKETSNFNQDIYKKRSITFNMNQILKIKDYCN